MTSQSSARTRSTRAIETRNVFLAEIAASELLRVNLEDALQLV